MSGYNEDRYSMLYTTDMSDGFTVVTETRLGKVNMKNNSNLTDDKTVSDYFTAPIVCEVIDFTNKNESNELLIDENRVYIEKISIIDVAFFAICQAFSSSRNIECLDSE